MADNIKQLAYQWMTADVDKIDVESSYYCQTRDVFEARNNKMLNFLIQNGVDENSAYLIYAITGELGNNSFDHNLGKWTGIMGVFFRYEYSKKTGLIIIADRGLGILGTLKTVVFNLNNHKDAIKLAFTKKISSRVLENRGNGLKFVKQNVINKNFYLELQSGNAKAKINHGMQIVSTDNHVNGCIAILNF